MRRDEIASLGFHYHNLVMEEAAQVTEVETFIPLALQDVKDGELPLQRVVLLGDHQQNSPIISNLAFRRFANLEQSLFLRLVRLGVPTIELDQQGRARPSIAQLYSWRYNKLDNLVDFKLANAGLAFDYQFINVPDYKGVGESEPTPHWIQNLGEAEYVVALYQYMRLLGYPADKISILTPYAGQRSLIKDVLSHRCARNKLFGLPKSVTTVDRYQGEQNDCKFSLDYKAPLTSVDVLLSLTRTNRVGYLRDIRRMTVALSRARLGLYIFGRRDVFESCFELKEAFDKLFERPDTLQLVAEELFPTTRLVAGSPQRSEIAGVEHLGQYVFQMTEAKLAMSKMRD
jgi:intron-binding protein aquarius